MGDNLPVNEIENRLDIRPSFTGKMGQHINGNPKYAKYPTHIWVWSVMDDSTIPFGRQIETVLEILEPKKHKLAKILASPGVEGELFLGFSSSNGQGNVYFSPSLLARLGALGLSLNLDLCPSGEDETD
ncbi:hypothetical protein IAD21_04351 [Abditibacteriota bacterium]|nr:hypothetical protein IAD21_04351 [Abditibacteriota bacterium]